MKTPRRRDRNDFLDKVLAPCSSFYLHLSENPAPVLCVSFLSLLMNYMLVYFDSLKIRKYMFFGKMTSHGSSQRMQWDTRALTRQTLEFSGYFVAMLQCLFK